MDSSHLEAFRQVWENKGRLTAHGHLEEILYYMHEADEKKQRAREDARTQLEDLRNRDISLVNFDDESRKIKGNLDATLELIEKASKEKIRGIEEIQRKEMADHEKAYHDALAARSSMNDISPNHSATEVVAAINQKTGVNSKKTGSASQLSASISTRSSPDRMLPTPDDISTITAAGEHDKSAMLAKHFSCTIQREYADGQEQLILRYQTENREALQEITELRDNQFLPVNSPVNPLPTPDNEHAASRTITFDEVFQKGQAKHKDTIVEFPSKSGRWYILKCEEHNIRFGPRPLLGAAKHLNSRLHGGLCKNWAVAIKMLGYRVIDCTKELASLNNDVVKDAFANGYKPVSLVNPENKTRRRQYVEISEDNSRETDATTTSISRKSTSSPSRKRHKADSKSPTEIITNPKTFHIYYCFWKDEERLYPVMILAWDDQKPGGLENDLVSTGLLDKNSNPPNCYIYKDTDSGKNKAIAGWAPGFEDGGPRVNQRKFPAMFLYVVILLVYPARGIELIRCYYSDPNQEVSWVSANLLSKFPLFEPNPPKKKSHPFNSARRWVAKNNGFASWEEFEEAQKGEGGGMLAARGSYVFKPTHLEKRERRVSTPSVSSISDIGDAKKDSNNESGSDDESDSDNESGSDTESDSDAESSVRSHTSNITEKVLQELRDKAGEITGDSDYAGSDADSTLDDEHEEWEQVETDGRPWAWYGLRNKSRTDPEKTESFVSTRESTPLNNETKTSVRKGMESARHLSTHACTGDEDSSAKRGPDAKTSPLEAPPRRTVENLAQDGGDQTLRRTPLPNLHGVNAVNQATPPKTPKAHIFRTPASLINELSLSSGETGELGESSERTKRGRSEERSETGSVTPRQRSTKKPKQSPGIPDNEVVMSVDPQPAASPLLSVAHLLKPKGPLESERNAEITDDQVAMSIDSDPMNSPLTPVEPLSKLKEPLGSKQSPGITDDQIAMSIDSQPVNSPPPLFQPKEPLEPKQNLEIPGNEVVMSIDSPPVNSPLPPVAPLFKPKEPLGPAVFELSFYIKGLVSWNRENEETSLKLYYGEGERMIGTVDAPVDIVIDPTTLRGISREEIPESKGNVVMTLFSKDSDEAPMKVVFNRAMGSKVGIGKVQSRKFLQWTRSIVPALPLLEG
ncbi:hypothetical protein FHL15_010064 [Xylaria flabelliformis]|uniref:Uncharacterized protein n=1 Tax=Xylaria flabelliformis TaxID=2512241 RepID=A0A553HM57_9PEZI|nr:hypothetical protein FHL15_010064 [Xylaria flabelliformis]